MNKQFTVLLGILFTSVVLVGCNKDNTPKPEQKQKYEGVEGFFHQAPKKFLTYDERIQKKKYEECLDQQKTDKNKEPCRVPNFLKD